MLIDYGEKQTTASLGIPGGSRTDRIRLVTDGETISSNMAGEMAFENDLHLQLFGGGNLHIGGRAVQAYINDGIAYVRVDAPNKTSAQLMQELVAPLQTAQEEVQPSGMPLEPDDLFNQQEIDAINAELQAEQLGEIKALPEREGLSTNNGLQDEEQKPYGSVENESESGILSKEDLHALDQYKSSHVAYPLNAILRGEAPMTEEYQRIAGDIERALSKLPVYQGTVYRSLRSAHIENVAAFWKKYMPGTYVTEESFTSASTEIYDSSMDIQMVIQSKNGRDMRVYNPLEQEILFKRGTRFFVEKRSGNTLWLREI